MEQLAIAGIPILGLGGPIADARTISVDEVGAGHLATEHLISLGHTKIGNISGTPASEMEFHQPNLRRQGYLDALKAAGLTARPSWLAEADFTIAGAYHATKQLLGDPRNAPTALFIASDEMAFGAIMAAKDLGLRVTKDVSIIGMDDHDMSEFFGLSTISQNVRQQGSNAAKTAIDLVENLKDGQPVNIEQNREWPSTLIVRSSTARPAVR